mgnify:CR=1 FL=1
MPISKHLHFLCLFIFVALAGCDTEFSPDVMVDFVAKLPGDLHESSALAVYDNILWSLNDSGNAPILFGFSKTGELLNTVKISNVSNTDWESLAHDDRYLYIADTGNNFNTRDRFEIYRVPLPDLDESTVNAEIISVSYPDRDSGYSLRHNYDAEAISIRNSELWLFTKNRDDGNTDLYRIPKTPGNYLLNKAQTLPVDSLVTGADINHQSNELALLTYGGSGFGEGSRVWWAPTSDEGVDWSQSYSISIGPSDQWEAIVWDGIDKMFLTHEESRQGFAGLSLLYKP